MSKGGTQMGSEPDSSEGGGSMWASIRRIMSGAGAAGPPGHRTEHHAQRNVASSTPTLRVAGVAADKLVAVEDLVKGVAAAASAVWKLQARMERERREQAFDPPKWLLRQMEGAQDALHAAGIEAKGHTGDKYVPGLAVNVIAFQPQVGITIDVIAETLKPSVFFRDGLIQPGEVIVSTPVVNDAPLVEVPNAPA
jgi:hypothetical protein